MDVLNRVENDFLKLLQEHHVKVSSLILTEKPIDSIGVEVRGGGVIEVIYDPEWLSLLSIDHLPAVLRHELCHVLLFDKLPNIPVPLFSEGVRETLFAYICTYAEYLAHLEFLRLFPQYQGALTDCFRLNVNVADSPIYLINETAEDAAYMFSAHTVSSQMWFSILYFWSHRLLFNISPDHTLQEQCEKHDAHAIYRCLQFVTRDFDLIAQIPDVSERSRVMTQSWRLLTCFVPTALMHNEVKFRQMGTWDELDWRLAANWMEMLSAAGT
jgi:hypothetical protein